MIVMSKLKSLYHFALALAAYWYYGRPARKMVVIGVTGTKGKSSTSRYIASVLQSGGKKVGLLTTVEFQIAEKRWLNDRKMTMLGRGQIQKMLRDMVRAGCTHVVVETSSEGILQYRHVGLEYDIAVFTNLGTEHQERHGGYEKLRRDKGKLFAALATSKRKVIDGNKIEKTIVVNGNDAEAGFYLSYAADKKIVYGVDALPSFTAAENLVATNVRTNEKGSEFTLGGSLYQLNIVGAFNVYNALPAIAIGRQLGCDPVSIAKGLASVRLIEGRMEFVEMGQMFRLVVDYAHEPMSLGALFTTLRELVGSDHKVIGIIGSDGGGRDVSKRPKMGKVAGELCDVVVVTDVNCFDENPHEIAEMLAAGARAAGKKDGENLFIEVDREKAIAKAITLAAPGDAIAVTAKGNEPCIVVAGGKKIPWSDAEVSQKLLKARLSS